MLSAPIATTNSQPFQASTSLTDIVHIKLSKSFPLTPCPINKTNRYRWTEDQRQKAERAVNIKNLHDLELKVFLSEIY